MSVAIIDTPAPIKTTTNKPVTLQRSAQSPLHDLWTRLLATMLQSYLAIHGWLIFHDVLIHWGRRRAPHKSPDITAIAGGQFPAEAEKSYQVGRDGPPPPFVIEITSEETREADLHEKSFFMPPLA
jgi:Uma2 family endonuclease